MIIGAQMFALREHEHPKPSAIKPKQKAGPPKKKPNYLMPKKLTRVTGRIKNYSRITW